MNKIAWVIPFASSGIGKYAEIVKRYLSNFELIIFSLEKRFELDIFSQFPLIVYNFGNTKESLFLYQAIRKYPGIAVLHDRTYHHLFAYYYLEYLKRPDLYYKALSFLYGESVAQYAKSQHIPIWETEDCVKYPMRELIYPYTTAVIVHSKNYLKTISKEYVGIKVYLPLPFEINDVSFDKYFDRKKLNLPDKKIILFSYGFINKNRMIEEVLRVIGENEEIKRNAFYIIAGNISDKYLDEINLIVKHYKLYENVRIYGYISDKELYQYLAVSDLCINLRRYNTEGASWSLLEQMFNEKAVITSDGGFFSELPDDVLIKVKDIKELKEKLIKIVFNPSILKDLGKKAKNYVIENFNPDFFIKNFKNLIEVSSFEINKKKILNKLLKELITAIPFMSYIIANNIEDRFLSSISKDFCEIFFRG